MKEMKYHIYLHFIFDTWSSELIHRYNLLWHPRWWWHSAEPHSSGQRSTWCGSAVTATCCPFALLSKIAPYWFPLKWLLQQHVMLYHHKLYYSVTSASSSGVGEGKCSQWDIKCPYEYVTLHSMPCATMNFGSVQKNVLFSLLHLFCMF